MSVADQLKALSSLAHALHELRTYVQARKPFDSRLNDLVTGAQARFDELARELKQAVAADPGPHPYDVGQPPPPPPPGPPGDTGGDS